MPQVDSQRSVPDTSAAPPLRVPIVRWNPGKLAASLLALALGVSAPTHAAAAQEQSVFEATLEPARLACVAAAFQTGELPPPPPRAAALGTKEMNTKLAAPAVMVESTVPGAPTEIRDLKGPLTASTGAPSWVWAALLMAGFVGLTAVTMALVRLPLAQRPPPLSEYDEDPDEQARRTLDALAGSGLLDRGELKEYYRRLATCLRTYLGRRLDTDAAAITPQELQRRLEALEVGRRSARLAANLLAQCEAVQSAPRRPARDRADADLSAAYELIALASESGGEQEPDH